MKVRWKKVVAMLAACGMAAGMLTACGGGDDGNDAPKADTENTGQETGGGADHGPVEVVVGTGMTWETATPFRTMRAYTVNYSRMLYDSLAYYADGELQPVVAKAWDMEEDGVTYNIEIFDYVEDSAGNHITAEDIVWMIEEQMAQGLKPFFAQIESVEQTGDYTLKVVLKKDVVGVFDYILQHTFVVSKTAYESDPDGFASEVVSTSPYLLTDFASNSSLTLEKRDDYWQKEELIPDCMANNVDKITFKYIGEASQQQIALETGEVDAYVSITQNLIPAFEGNDGFVVAKTPGAVVTKLAFSGDDSRAIAKDENLRKAIAYAIDEEGIIAGVYGGYGEAAHEGIPNNTPGYLAKWDEEEYYPYDVDKAKEYLAKSDYHGEELEILMSSSTVNERLGTMIQSYLLEAGINLKLNIVERALFSSMMYDGSGFDMKLDNPGGGDLVMLWEAAYSMNAYESGSSAGWHDAELTEMIETISTSEGYTEENIEKIHEYLMDQMQDYGICQPMQCDIYSTKLGIAEEVELPLGGIDFAASVYGK